MVGNLCCACFTCIRGSLELSIMCNKISRYEVKILLNPWGKLRPQIPSVALVHNILWGLWSAMSLNSITPIVRGVSLCFTAGRQKLTVVVQLVDEGIGVEATGVSVPHTVGVWFWWGFPHGLPLCTPTEKERLEGCWKLIIALLPTLHLHHLGLRVSCSCWLAVTLLWHSLGLFFWYISTSIKYLLHNWKFAKIKSVLRGSWRQTAIFNRQQLRWYRHPYILSVNVCVFVCSCAYMHFYAISFSILSQRRNGARKASETHGRARSYSHGELVYSVVYVWGKYATITMYMPLPWWFVSLADTVHKP